MLRKKSWFGDCREAILPVNPLQAMQEQNDEYLQCVWDCFESNTLEWDQDPTVWSQKLQFQNDPCTYPTMEPTTKVGKNGHAWRSTPIPDTAQVANGGEGKCTWDSVQSFGSPAAREEFVASFGGEDVCNTGLDAHNPPDWHVFDKVKVPDDLEEGEYLLSWRWEAYTADQMWTNCADVVIAATGGGSEPPEDGCQTAPSSAAPSQSPVRQASSPTTAPTEPPAPTTPPVGSNCPSGYTGIVPNGDCTKYRHCRHDQALGDLLDCSAGTLFDAGLQQCNWASLVVCEDEPPAPPTGLDCPSGFTGMVPHANCTKYHHCQNGQIVGNLLECSADTLFDAELQQCSWASTVTYEEH